MIKQNPSFLENVAASTLWSESLPCWIQYFFLVISNLQCIAISFSSCFLVLKSPQPDTFIQVLKAFSNLMAFRDILRQNENDSLSIVIIISTLLYFSILISTFIFASINGLLRRKLSNSSILFINILSQFHLAFGFWSTNMIFIEALDNNQSDGLFALSIFANSTLIRIVYLTLMTIGFIFGIFMALFSYNPFINSRGLSAHNIGFQLMTFLIKACLTITIFAQSLLLEGDTSWFLFGISLVWMVVRHYQLIRNFPYYEYSAMKVATFLSLICLLNSIVGIIAKSLSQSIDLSVLQVFFMNVLMIPFLIKFWHDYFHRLFEQYLSSPNQNIKSEEVAFKKLFCLRHLSNRAKIGNNNEQAADLFELYFFGFFALPHEKEELFQNKFIKNENTDEDNSKNVNASNGNLNNRVTELQDSFAKTWKKKIIGLLQDFIISKKSNKFRIILTCLFLENIENLSTSTYYLGTVSKSEGLNKIIALKLFDKLERKIQHMLVEKEGKNLNVQEIINLEAISTKLIQMIYSNSQKYIKFWKTYNNMKLEMKDLYKRSKEIENEYDIIENFWNKTIEKNPRFACSLSAVYSTYLSVVRNSPASAERMFEKYRRMASHKIFNKLKDEDDNCEMTDEILSSPNSIMLHVSMTKEKLGKIVYASSNIVEVLGWQKQSLWGQNINMIMPNFLQEQHNQIMTSHSDKIIKGTALTNLHRTNRGFVKDKTNCILPCQVYLSLHPFIQSELTYVSLIKIENIKYEHLLMSKTGSIEGFSRGVAAQLNLTTERRIHIKEICNNYSVLNEYLLKYDLEDVSEDNVSQENKRLVGTFTSELVLQLSRQTNAEKEQKRISFEYFAGLTSFKMGDLVYVALNLTKINSSKNIQNYRLLQLKKEELVEEDDFEIPQEKLLSENVTLFSPVSSFTKKSSSQVSFIRKINVAKISSETEMIPQVKETGKFSKVFEEVCQSSKSSFDKSSTKDKRNQEKKVAAKMLKNLDAFDTSSVSAAKKHSIQFEQAAKMVPKEVGWRILQISLAIYLFIPVITSTIFQVQNSRTLDKIEGNIDILSASTFRLAKITELSRALRTLVLMDVGLFYMERFDALFGPGINLKYEAAASAKQYSNELNTLNSNIRDSIYKIESDLQEVINDKIPVYDLDSMGTTSYIRVLNPFDLVAELIAAGNKIANMPLDQINPENHEVKFILNNTMNDILISGEKISPILLEDTRVKLENQKFLIIIFMVLQSCFLVTVLIIFYGIVGNFLSKRSQFIDILLYLGKDSTENQTYVVEKFTSFLEKNDMDGKRINLKLEPEQFMNPEVNPMLQNAKSKRMTADLKGINVSLIKNTINLILFLCLIFSINIVFISFTGTQKKIISSKINIMSESNAILYKLKLLRVTLIGYIQEDGANVVRNNFAKFEWENLFSQLLNFQSFFAIDLLDKDYGIGDDEEISLIVKGNICNALNVAPQVKPLCSILASGALEKGLIGLNTYFLDSLTRIKSTYDNSQKSFFDKYLAINSADMIIIDILEYTFSYQAFELVDRLVKSRIKGDLIDFKTYLETIIIIYTVISLLFGILAWYKITSNLEEEFGSWRKMIRLIPYGILIHNKLVKSFLIKTSGGFLNKLH